MGKKKQTSETKLPKSLRKGGLPRPVADVWAAGVGALAEARKEGGESFDALVEIGATVAETGSKAARSAVEQVESAAGRVAGLARGLAGGAADGVQGRVEDVVEGVLIRLGVPGRDEVLALQAQVDALQSKIGDLSQPPASPAEARSASPSEAPSAGDQAASADPDRAAYRVARHDRGWSVQRDGAERAASVHATKKEALVDARRTARAHAPSRLVVLKADGSVEAETDYDA